MEFTVQKLLPKLRSGRRLTIVGSNVPAFSFQGAWDGGCALHATAMAIAMLGRLSDPLRVPSRRRGPEAAFWELAWPFYLSGVTLEELENLILELGWGLRPTLFEGAHANIFRFCEQEILRSRPVIVTWRQLRRAALHATLIVGIEGRQIGRDFEGHTLLVIDSAEAEPMLAAHNARLTWSAERRGRQSGYARYVTAFDERKVVLVGAMSIRAGKPP
ncbi:hypothetical protein [Burkholderia pseudomallei]|uniref:hypothetical protein n=1 Tax=Burkholderia pseudomallei TaxID=28450 RepID=UPI0009775157|nr:hypothetical protein [Burkholderia pseudomallei]